MALYPTLLPWPLPHPTDCLDSTTPHTPPLALPPPCRYLRHNCLDYTPPLPLPALTQLHPTIAFTPSTSIRPCSHPQSHMRPRKSRGKSRGYPQHLTPLPRAYSSEPHHVLLPPLLPRALVFLPSAPAPRTTKQSLHAVRARVTSIACRLEQCLHACNTQGSLALNPKLNPKS